MSKKRSVKRLKSLLRSGAITRAEYNRLTTKTKRVSRKKRETALRNLRRGCKKVLGKSGKRSRTDSKLESQVKKLRGEVSSIYRKERLKNELQRLKEERRTLRDALRRQPKNGGFIF